MRPEHLPGVMRVERLSFSSPWSEASFVLEMQSPGSESRVALREADVVGYICTKKNQDKAHLLKLAVHPSMRRQGIARALLAETLRSLRAGGCKRVYLEVRASNSTAQGIYEALGFRASGTRKTYYHSPEEDATIMVLEI
jgi:ribosomal-protein-alanine N-acetyltransferase